MIRLSVASKGIPLMEQCQNRVAKDHSRARVSHNILDLRLQERLKAMHGTMGAGILFRAERTLFQSVMGIIEQCFTFVAKRILRGMVGSAIDLDHRRDGSLFATDPGRFGRGFLIHGPLDAGVFLPSSLQLYGRSRIGALIWDKRWREKRGDLPILTALPGYFGFDWPTFF
jgi:hypothetical protein